MGTYHNEQRKRILGLWSGVGIIVGVMSLWFAGLYSLLVGIIAVFISIFASRRGEKLSTFGMILGSIAVIFVNLQFIGIVKHNPKVNKDMKHIFKSIIISNQAYEILKNSAVHHKRIGEEDINKMVSLWEKAIKEAEKVDVDNMNKYIPEFSKHYKEEFIKGLNLLVDGFKNSNNVKKLQGAFLLDRWGIWNNKNRDIYIKIKNTKVSFVEFITNVIK